MRHLTGSTYFFGSLPFFKGRDVDYVEVVDDQSIDIVKLREPGTDVFRVRRMPIEDRLARDSEVQATSRICNYLVPEIAAELGFTPDMLDRIKPIVDRLRPRYSYLGVIYEGYVENGSFTLTEEQRMAAFEEYRRSRVALGLSPDTTSVKKQKQAKNPKEVMTDVGFEHRKIRR